ncbi:MAG: hypothetical protein HDT39_11835 [Lachnospiraceae bacterium]|nr:hypothetical protein [Lachnospiraceae bacterium]
MKKGLVYSFLFNADSINYSDWYGRDIEKLIWSCGVLQTVNRTITVYRGDILATSYVKNLAQLMEWALTLFSTLSNPQKAIYALLYGNVYVWTIDNLEDKEVRELNEKLLKDIGYLGYVKLNEEQCLHRIFYFDMLIKGYVIENQNILICAYGTEYDDYLEEISFLKSYGFEQVELQGGYNEY